MNLMPALRENGRKFLNFYVLKEVLQDRLNLKDGHLFKYCIYTQRKIFVLFHNDCI